MNRFKTLTKMIAGVVLAGAMVSGCSLQLTSYDHAFEDGPFKGADNGKNAFIHMYTWDGDTSNMVIDIPTEHDGLPVTKLGGTWERGMPMDFEFYDASKEDLPYYEPPKEYTSFVDKALSSDEIVYYDFEMRIGKDINSITVYNNLQAMDLRVVDGRNICYIYRFYIVCEDGNDFYYSRDGILYDLATGKKINSFFYWNEEIETLN